MKTIQEDKKKNIIVELENGKSIREIAALFDVSKSYVHEVRNSTTKIFNVNVGGRKQSYHLNLKGTVQGLLHLVDKNPLVKWQ